MPLILEPELPATDLRGRLGKLRRRIRARTALGGGVAIAGVLIATLALGGWLDFGLDLPGPMRAALLFAWLVAAVILWRGWVRRPWREAGDELRLALAVERQVPGLHDALASAIEFGDEEWGSPQLRDATVLYATQRTSSVDFGDYSERGQFGRWWLLGIAGAMLLVALTRLAGVLPLVRFFDPVGQHPWPTKTSIALNAPSILARGDAFEFTANIAGVVPDRATLRLTLDGATTVEQSYALTPQPSGGSESLPIKLEPARVPRSFSYQILANDATTGWQSVEVRVKPELAPLDGRASPQMWLVYPLYTDLPSLRLPDGAGAIEAVAGTAVHVRAATDQAVDRARIEYRPLDPRGHAKLAVSALTAPHVISALVPLVVAAPTALTVAADGLTLGGKFVPLASGNYDIEFQATAGLAGRKPLDVRVSADPSPAVTLEEPGAGGDGVELLPDAAFTIRATVADPIYAVRAAEVQYRTRGDEPWRSLALYDGQLLGSAIGSLLPHVPGYTKLRPKQLELAQRFNVAAFRHVNGKPLAAGDVLTIAIAVGDFDDVSPTKPWGCSAEVELRIVGRDRLEARVHKSRGELLKALKQLLELQRDALARAAAVETRRRSTGTMTDADRAALGQSSSTQGQVLERLGDERDGARADARRLQQLLADNPGTPAPVKAAANLIVNELDRLARDVLEPTPALLGAARQETGTVPPAERAAGPLPESVRRQSEAERTLRELIERLEAGGAAAGLAAEAATIAAEQELLRSRRDDLARTIPPGADPNKLPDAERNGLAQAKERQDALAQRAAGMARQLAALADTQRQQAAAEVAKADAADRMAADLTPEFAGAKRREAETARDKADTLNREADALTAAGLIARGDDKTAALAETMAKAADALGGNRLAEAQEQQRAAAERLERIRETLRGPSQPDLEKLAKEHRRAEQQVNDLVRQQETLQDRTLAAEKNPDRLSKRKELEQLEREQQRLAEEANEAARELKRQGQPEAARDLENAARQMEKAKEELARGESASSTQDDALQQLDEAARQAQQARAESEEHLAREKLAQLAGRVTGLADRQTAMAAEGDRLFQTAQAARGWSRALQKSLSDLGRDEDALGSEIGKLAEEKLAGYPVFRRLAEQAATALAEVNLAVEEARAAGLTAETLEADRVAVRAPQELAKKRLAQLRGALAPPKDEEKPSATAAAPAQPGGGPGSDTPPPPGDGVPPAAQLKLLRDLQLELRERVEEIVAKQPDVTKWTPAQRAALDRLRREQAELAELFNALTPTAPPPEVKK